MDAGDGGGGGGAGTSMAMAADLMRAAEASSARAAAADPTIASLQTAMQAVLNDRALEAEGNRKVSAALAGQVHFQPLGDGRVVVRYSTIDVNGGACHSFPHCLLTVYRWTRPHSPHPPLWPYTSYIKQSGIPGQGPGKRRATV